MPAEHADANSAYRASQRKRTPAPDVNRVRQFVQSVRKKSSFEAQRKLPRLFSRFTRLLHFSFTSWNRLFAFAEQLWQTFSLDSLPVSKRKVQVEALVRAHETFPFVRTDSALNSVLGPADLTHLHLRPLATLFYATLVFPVFNIYFVFPSYRWRIHVMCCGLIYYPGCIWPY